jgi:hypothetical protein
VLGAGKSAAAKALGSNLKPIYDPMLGLNLATEFVPNALS